MFCLIANASLRVALRRISVSGFVVLTLMLAACGGGGGSEGSRLDSKSPYTDKPASGSGTQGDTDVVSDGDGDQAAQEPDDETPDNDTGTDTTETPSGDSGSDDSDTEAGSGGAEPDPGTDQPTAGDDSGLLEGVVAEVNGTVRLEWDRPEFRENGEYLEADDIGGYELRYRQVGQEGFETVIVNDGWDEDHELGELEGLYEFTIAAFDNNGLYSEFVSLAPVTGLAESL